MVPVVLGHVSEVELVLFNSLLDIISIVLVIGFELACEELVVVWDAYFMVLVISQRSLVDNINCL